MVASGFTTRGFTMLPALCLLTVRAMATCSSKEQL